MDVKIEGVPQFTSDLKRFMSEYIKRPFVDRRLINKLEKAFWRYMKKIFSSEGAASGPEWKSLSDVPEGKGYKTWKAKHYPGKTILRRKDRLYKSLTSQGSESHTSVHGVPHGSELWLGSDVPYGVYHDSTKPRTSNLPRRPIIRFSDKMIRGFHNIIHKHIEYGIKKTMGKNESPAWKVIEGAMDK